MSVCHKEGWLRFCLCLPPVPTVPHRDLDHTWQHRYSRYPLVFLLSHPPALAVVVLVLWDLGRFIDKLDTLLSLFPEHGIPLILQGSPSPGDPQDLNWLLILGWKQKYRCSRETSTFTWKSPSLLPSYHFSLQHCAPTHKAGNLLDLICYISDG